MLARLAFDVVI